jgi:hypothetical protein
MHLIFSQIRFLFRFQHDGEKMMQKIKESNGSNNNIFLTRMELWFAPFLFIIPIIVAIFFILEWFTQGFLQGSNSYDGEGILGCVIFGGNLLFDIPFIQTLLKPGKK